MGGITFAHGDQNFSVPMKNVEREPGLSFYGHLLRCTSEGSVHIRSADADAPPSIVPNWLSTEADKRAAIDAIRYMRRLASQPALAPYIDHEILPGASVQSDEDILRSLQTAIVEWFARGRHLPHGRRQLCGCRRAAVRAGRRALASCGSFGCARLDFGKHACFRDGDRVAGCRSHHGGRPRLRRVGAKFGRRSCLRLRARRVRRPATPGSGRRAARGDLRRTKIDNVCTYPSMIDYIAACR